jgi:hypothetical protein
MTTRKMTNKMFLHRANGKAAIAASAFISAHREFLQSGELQLFTTPILNRLDTQELFPTPALEELKAVVLAHHMAEEIRIATEKMAKADEPTERKTKNYVATVWNSKGEVVQAPDSNGKIKDLKDSFETSTQAERWADNRLFDGATDWFCVVETTHVFKQNGDPFTATILRADAIARILKRPKAPVMKAQKKSGGRLSFGVKAHQTKAAFSHG